MKPTPPPPMHEGELLPDASWVRRLLEAQFPQWSGLDIAPVSSSGTGNAIYRLGSEWVVRLPRISWAEKQVHLEHRWLPKLSPHLPLALPEPVALGDPGEGYPWHWSIYRWLPGRPAQLEGLADPEAAAVSLAQFLHALHRIDATDGPLATAQNNARGLPLQGRDADVRAAIDALQGELDAPRVLAAWEEALEAKAWTGPPTWFHGDLLPGNLLMDQGQLAAVIDLGCMGIGDPACDAMVAWSLFEGRSREAFREALGWDPDTWLRGRGHALAQALIFIPYYLHTNPIGVRQARHQLGQLLGP